MRSRKPRRSVFIDWPTLSSVPGYFGFNFWAGVPAAAHRSPGDPHYDRSWHLFRTSGLIVLEIVMWPVSRQEFFDSTIIWVIISLISGPKLNSTKHATRLQFTTRIFLITTFPTPLAPPSLRPHPQDASHLAPPWTALRLGNRGGLQPYPQSTPERLAVEHPRPESFLHWCISNVQVEYSHV